MKTYESQNRLIGEINTSFMQDVSVVTTNTIYNANNVMLPYELRSQKRSGVVRDSRYSQLQLMWSICAIFLTQQLADMLRNCLTNEEHIWQREMDAMEQADQEWVEILATHRAICEEEPEEGQ